jgi:hypothetical protein
MPEFPLEALVVAAQHGMEQVYQAIFDAAYSLIALEEREGPEIAHAAAGPIEAAYEVVESEEQKALYEALYRATNPHPLPEIWETRRAEIAGILATYGAKRAAA